VTLDELRSSHAHIETLAYQDSLTRLFNRRRFLEVLEASLDTATRSQSRVALYFLDLDDFKIINDTLGHEMGDALLKSVSARLESVVSELVGESGFVARLGGDEFTIIVDSDSLDADLEGLMPAVLDTLSAAHLLAEESIRVSASIGCAICPDHGRDASTLLNCADAAMYEAKAGGKNDFVMYQKAFEDASMRVASELCPDEPADTVHDAGTGQSRCVEGLHRRVA